MFSYQLGKEKAAGESPIPLSRWIVYHIFRNPSIGILVFERLPLELAYAGCPSGGIPADCALAVYYGEEAPVAVHRAALFDLLAFGYEYLDGTPMRSAITATADEVFFGFFISFLLLFFLLKC